MKSLVIILVLAAVVYLTPLRAPVMASVQRASAFLESNLASTSAPLYARIQTFGGSVRSKSMELLRQELHDAINGLVK